MFSSLSFAYFALEVAFKQQAQDPPAGASEELKVILIKQLEEERSNVRKWICRMFKEI